jgi:hypothetical protein
METGEFRQLFGSQREEMDTLFISELWPTIQRLYLTGTKDVQSF